MKWTTPFSPYLRNWWLLLLPLIVIVFSCNATPSPKAKLNNKLHQYLTRMGIEEPINGVFTFVPSYGCKWCRTMVSNHATAMLGSASHMLIVADRTINLPKHPQMLRDTSGLLDRSGLARGVITRYYVEAGQMVKVDTLGINYFSRWLSSYLPSSGT